MEYVKGKTTYRKLSEKHGIAESTIRKRASKEGWRKKKNKLDTEVEQKALARICDARAQEFAQLAMINDQMSSVLDNLVRFVQQQPERLIKDLKGVESLTKAISTVVQTKRDLYNLPNEVDKAKIETLREKSRLEREKFAEEQAEKAASRTAAASTVFQVIVEGEEAALDE